MLEILTVLGKAILVGFGFCVGVILLYIFIVVIVGIIEIVCSGD